VVADASVDAAVLTAEVVAAALFADVLTAPLLPLLDPHAARTPTATASTTHCRIRIGRSAESGALEAVTAAGTPR